MIVHSHAIIAISGSACSFKLVFEMANGNGFAYFACSFKTKGNLTKHMKSKSHTKNYTASNGTISSAQQCGTQSSESESDDSEMESSGECWAFASLLVFFPWHCARFQQYHTLNTIAR